MSVIAFIPARAGSSRIPRKNLSDGPEIEGDTLLMRACRSVTSCTNRIVISTDDIPTGEWAEGVGCEWHRRPASLSGPHAQIEDAISHWMHRCDPVLDDADVIVLAQLTSPFRKPGTVRRCVELVQSGYDSAITICLNARRTGRHRSHADGVPRSIWNSPPSFRPRSQDGGPGRKRPEENGVCYAFSAAHFRRTGLRMGGNEANVITDWLEAFEIDTPQDLERARALAGLA